MIAISVKGNTYTSIAEAWRETSPPDLKLITVRLRLRLGWDADEAFTTPTVPPKLRRQFNKGKK